MEITMKALTIISLVILLTACGKNVATDADAGTDVDVVQDAEDAVDVATEVTPSADVSPVSAPADASSVD